MSNVERFVFPTTGGSVRVVMIDGEPWFVGKDIATALGYASPRDAVWKHVPAAHKGESRFATPSGDQEMTVIDEPGMYRLIMRSKTPLAEPFQEWVTADVLPTIRKTGSYGEPKLPDLETHEGRIQMLEMAMAAEKRAMEAEAKIKDLEPDAERARQTMDADGAKLLRNVAKRFGIGEKKLRDFLFDQKLLIRYGDSRNEPYAEYVKSGHFTVKTRLIHRGMDEAPKYASTTLVTGKGETLIWKRLYEHGWVASKVMPPEQVELEF